MKRYIIIAIVIAACLALCVAVWPQTGTVEETPVPIQATAVGTPEPAVEDAASEAEITLPAEEGKVETPQAELLHEDIPELESVPEKVPATPEEQPTLEPEPAPAMAPTPVPTPSQTVTDPQPGNMVYVPGFGWLECQGPGEVIHDENMYENGNKIGVMG